VRNYIVFLSLCGALLAFGCSKPVPAPELKLDIGPGKAFSYLRPSGWKGSGQVEVGGNAGSIELTYNTATLRIGADLTGSLRAASKPAVERLHDQQAASLSKKLTEFKDGKMQPLLAKMGEGRFSEFTGKDGSLELHGYRVTILGSDKRYTVRAQCAESDWATLKPVYEKIIGSIAPGPEN
jgi:hypothetical protein